MHRLGNGKRQAMLAWGVVFFFLAAGNARALSAPSLAGPANGATLPSLPVFKWNAVSGAAKYEIQVSADAGFSSVTEGGSFFTRNIRATLKRALPNGRLYWRVRTSDANGAVSAWSAKRSIVKAWAQAPTPVYPAGGATLTYPANPLRLTWSAVPRTYKYSVTIASDPLLATPLDGFPILTSATSLTHQPADLKPDTYYWSVTPQDARGNKGAPSPVSSFVWNWPTGMTPALEDLVAADEVFDPRFSWGLVPGAASYEVEVNSDDTFDTGSVVLDQVTLGSSLAPRQVLPNNTYYWRVRAIDPDGNKGVWNAGDPFQKSFADETVLGRTSVTNLRMFFPDDDAGTAGYQTTTPLVAWDAVPGASSYEVQVGTWTGAVCNYNTPLTAITATNAWTPLGPAPAGDPYSTPAFSAPVNDSIKAILPGSDYCVRVRPRDRSDTSTSDGDRLVVGTYTELGSGTFSFSWTGYPSGSACSPSCSPGYLGAGDYVAPLKGSTTGAMPAFRWNPVSGAQSYFVVVARDSAFTTVVDYAFTRVPVYAPRRSAGNSLSRTYSDETTNFYWVVLPSPNLNGGAAASNPLNGAASNFLKQTTPPTLLGPADGANVSTWPTFRWTPVDGARVYEIQVDDAPTFASPLDTKKTNSTAYTSETTYPADTLLYWRVRPLDDERTALTWSDVGTFRRKLPTPVWNSGLPSGGSTTPTFSWAPITGAISYDLDTDLSDGTHKAWNDLRSAALTYVYFYGTGVFGQRVRANFASAVGAATHGPWSTTLNFTRTIPAPGSPSTSVSGKGVSLSWSSRAEAREYRVQISRTSDFAQPVETTTTDNTNYAPPMTSSSYLAGGKFFWRVAAVDEGRNVGHYTAARSFTTLKGLRLSAIGTPKKGERVSIRFYVRRYSGSAGVGGATVRLWGSGIGTKTKRTRTDGSVTFAVRATRRGTVWVKATKFGFRDARIALEVR